VSTLETAPAKLTAVLVAVHLPGVRDEDFAAELAELGRLANTLGYEVVATVTQRRQGVSSASVLGKGKLRELARWTGGSGVIGSGAPEVKNKAREKWSASEGEDAEATDEEAEETEDEAPIDESAPLTKAALVIVDHELSPSQARNLERATGASVLDRTAVIMDIFHRHAKSREARMQVEIARLNYVAPRMRESGGGRERHAGRGAGESALELDRRKIRDRIAELKAALEVLQQDDANRRYARRDQLRVALVGYTNAGKSSLMRALTGSEVLVADKLFATLDTTVRALTPETKPRILVSDTVGFIQKLPHDLVASFRSTLDEALEASLLLYVVDAADPTSESQLGVTREVLREIGAESVPSLLVLNKRDRLDEAARAAAMERHPDAILMSAHEPDDVVMLRARIIEFFESSMVEAELVLPYAKQGLVGEIYESVHVLAETFDEAGRHLRVRVLPAMLAKLERALAQTKG
jgi:GTP-binding protein HflX